MVPLTGGTPAEKKSQERSNQRQQRKIFDCVIGFIAVAGFIMGLSALIWVSTIGHGHSRRNDKWGDTSWNEDGVTHNYHHLHGMTPPPPSPPPPEEDMQDMSRRLMAVTPPPPSPQMYITTTQKVGMTTVITSSANPNILSHASVVSGVAIMPVTDSDVVNTDVVLPVVTIQAIAVDAGAPIDPNSRRLLATYSSNSCVETVPGPCRQKGWQPWNISMFGANCAKCPNGFFTETNAYSNVTVTGGRMCRSDCRKDIRGRLCVYGDIVTNQTIYATKFVVYNATSNTTLFPCLTSNPSGVCAGGGAQGPKGDPGQNGTCPKACFNGTAGPPGPPGVCTQPCINGSTGATGPAGPPGVCTQPCQNGTTGPVGPPGTPGVCTQPCINGSTGATGPAGPPGVCTQPCINGSKGDPGDTGPPGPPGSNATCSDCPPGPVGPKGDPGTNATCSDCPAGPPGPAGANGTCTVPCVNGTNGSTGPQGPPGVCTHPCVNGTQGPKGDPGANGTDGICALPCVNGTQGVQGPKGDPGTNGTCTQPCFNGTQGPKGDPGTGANISTAAHCAPNKTVPVNITTVTCVPDPIPGLVCPNGSTPTAMNPGDQVLFCAPNNASQLSLSCPNGTTVNCAMGSVGLPASQAVVCPACTKIIATACGRTCPIGGTPATITSATGTGVCKNFVSSTSQFQRSFNCPIGSVSPSVLCTLRLFTPGDPSEYICPTCLWADANTTCCTNVATVSTINTNVTGLCSVDCTDGAPLIYLNGAIACGPSTQPTLPTCANYDSLVSINGSFVCQCNDGIQDGQEQGVDCGGLCPNLCKPCSTAACVERQCPGIICPSGSELVFTSSRECVCAVPAVGVDVIFSFACFGPLSFQTCPSISNPLPGALGLTPTYNRICPQCPGSTPISGTCAFCPAGTVQQALPAESVGPMFLRTCVTNASVSALTCPGAVCDSVCVPLSGFPSTLCSPCVHYQPNPFDSLATSCTIGNCPNCTDGIRNGDEIGVDCGGSCPASCCSHNLPALVQLNETNTLIDAMASCPATCASFSSTAWYGNITVRIAPTQVNCTCVSTNCAATCASFTTNPGQGCMIGPVHVAKTITIYGGVNCASMTAPQKQSNCSSACAAFGNGCTITLGNSCDAIFGCLDCICF